MTNHRSEIFAISDEYIDTLGRMSPMGATALGIPGYDHLLDDFSIAAETKVAEYRRDVLTRVQAMEPKDDIDRIAKENSREGLSHHRADPGRFDHHWRALP